MVAKASAAALVQHDMRGRRLVGAACNPGIPLVHCSQSNIATSSLACSHS